MTLYLSRARLRAGRGEALSAIAPLLLSNDPGRQAGQSHRILWLLFQDIPDAGHDPDWRRRDDGFLWRDEGNGRYLILSRQAPSDPYRLFDLDTKEFAPDLAVGDRLRFAMRVNPVRTTKRAGTKQGKNGRLRGTRVDVVMDALKAVPKTDIDRRTGRAFERDRIAVEAGSAWLAEQGARHGFRLSDQHAPTIESYTQIDVPRARRPGTRGRPAGFGILDIAGEVTITDPAAFLAKLPLGFGKAKAFGCGLMLIRRA
ncbi:MAG: type I-E CRISPR-associated protein Cas6/Cse3/CasE [Hyphomicrobiaceae bacterium]